ncbi:MAG: hypothetical protein KAX20_02485 [Candidatus Omnitrophica bacterium]|nr:hypothetical protein [Candidatus Omnitrophota bacterium]
MKKIIFAYSLSILFVLSSFALAEEKVYTCSRLTKEPVLDGRIEEPAWKNIPEAGDFVILKTESLATKQTSFKIGYNDEAIYIGIKCVEPEMEKIVVKDGHTDFTNLWNENSIEIFIFPKGTDNYYHFVVSSIGSRWNGIGKGDPKIPLLNWQAKSYKGEDFYSIEIRIPFEIFYTVPEKGEKWRINIARNNYTGSREKYTCWPYLKMGFHDLDNFGKIIFPEKVPDEKIRSSAVSYFRGKISASLKILSNFKKELPQRETDFLIINLIEGAPETAKSNELERVGFNSVGKGLKVEKWQNLVSMRTKLYQ